MTACSLEMVQQLMNIFKQFKQITTYFQNNDKQPEQTHQKPRSNSFQIIVSEILEEPPSQDFVLLEEHCKEELDMPSQGVQNMYIRGFLLIGKQCEGKQLTVDQWRNIIKTSDLSLASKKDIYFSIFQGIDFTVRKDVWEVLANVSEMKKEGKLRYSELCDPSRLSEKELSAIEKDVVRTTIVTKRLKELKEILVAYANLSQKGYTQGMNLIAGVLLRLLQIENDVKMEGHAIVEQELCERVFWVLVGIMKCKKWSQVYENDLVGTQRMLQVLRGLMVDHVPKLLSRIQDQGWDLTIFAQYYVTICLYNCPPELAPIVLDLFLLDGQSVIHSLLIRMMVLNESKILSFTDEVILMKYLKSQMLNDTYARLIKNRTHAKCLQDFDLNFLKTSC